jgi:hypothetical protein
MPTRVPCRHNVTGILALGVSIQWTRSGPPDLTPLVAMFAAILIARFVIRVPLTLPRTLAAAAAGAAWAAAVGSWGFTMPTLAALATVGLLSVAVGHADTS